MVDANGGVDDCLRGRLGHGDGDGCVAGATDEGVVVEVGIGIDVVDG